MQINRGIGVVEQWNAPRRNAKRGSGLSYHRNQGDQS
jgi:hypothetical protein